MTAWNGKQWIGTAVLALGVVWIASTRHFSPEGTIGGLACAFAVITARFVPAFWPRLQTAQRVCLILAPIGVLWILLCTANRNQNARLVSTSLDRGFCRHLRALLALFKSYGCSNGCVSEEADRSDARTQLHPFNTEAARSQTPSAIPPAPACPAPRGRGPSR
jgi:hypothetical protein